MSKFEISVATAITQSELVDLYSSVGWSAYTDDPRALAQAIEQSSFVMSARDESGALVGLARAISDDVSICYLQDSLALSSG